MEERVRAGNGSNAVAPRIGPGALGRAADNGAMKTTLGWFVLVVGLASVLVVSPSSGAGSADLAPNGVRPPAGAREVARVLCGIDALERARFAPLADARVGLITNHTGLTRDGRRTVDVLRAAPSVDLVALFSPEHGFEGTLDQEGIEDTTDGASGLRVFSLYGETRRPTAAMLEGVDVLVFDVQDVGCRFYTYVSTMGLALEAAAEHGVRFVVLDRPNPIGGRVEGPLLDEGAESFVGFHRVCVRHGMTVGELARMFVAERGLEVELEVVEVEGWERAMLWSDTDLVFTAPSPNLRRLSQALLYPGVGLLEFTNVSVGRGTDTPFERIGAPWIDGAAWARALRGPGVMGVEGVTFTPVRFTPSSSVFAGEACEGLDLFVTDWDAVRPVELGLALAKTLRSTFGEDWDDQRFDRLLGDRTTLTDLRRGTLLYVTLARWRSEQAAFEVRRAPHLLYD